MSVRTAIGGRIASLAAQAELPANPREFLPYAERYGLITEIDLFMIGEAVALAGRGRNVAVNLSARSIGDKRVIDELAAKLGATDVDPARLMFEITETAASESPEAAKEFSARVAELGCGLSLDDFGTGFASLAYLKQLTVQQLKIDMSFVKNLVDDPENQRLVKSIVAIAKEFGLTTVTESVESVTTMAMLRDFGVDFAQGYLIARHAPVDLAEPPTRS